MKLSQKEEELMNHIWSYDKAFMKDIMEAYPQPKPAPTTVATLLKRLHTKGAVGYNLYGNSREYYPLIKKNDYSSSYLKNMIKTFFGGSTTRFASFFTSNIELNKEELMELRDLIEEKIKNKK